MASAIVPARKQKVSSNDAAILNKVKATHGPDGRDPDLKLLFHIIEDIFNRASPNNPGPVQGAQTQRDALGDKSLPTGYGDIINKISCEVTCKCSDREDALITTLAIFKLVSYFMWDAKIVLSLAALAVYYGESRLFGQLHTVNLLAKSVAAIKELPMFEEHSDSPKPKHEAILTLIRAMINVVDCIMDLKELEQQYITHVSTTYKSAIALFPTASYWIIRSIVVCTSELMGMHNVSYESTSSTADAWELSSLTNKINHIDESLRRQTHLCHQVIGERKHREVCQKLSGILTSTNPDNMKSLNALIDAKKDLLPLFEGSRNIRVSMDVLRRKNVLLIISDLDIPHEELAILEQIYQESRLHPARMESLYEVVWLPVVDKSAPWTEQQQQQFEDLQEMMPWYAVSHPSFIDPEIARYIKEEWNFIKKPMLVVLDPQGRIVNLDAFHMMWNWGTTAFPFTKLREEALWSEEVWRLELLVDGINPILFQWLSEDKVHICLYGGEDIDWIRKFTKTADDVANAANIKLQMVYAGKSNSKEKVRKINTIIVKEKLSNVWPDLDLVWFFWVRLESMLHSKVKHGTSTEEDPIMRGIVTMLSFDASEQGWALIDLGPEMAKARGDTFLDCLNNFNEWKADIGVKGFIKKKKKIDYLQKLQKPHYCNRVVLPKTSSIPKKVACAECGNVMEKFILYRCSPNQVLTPQTLSLQHKKWQPHPRLPKVLNLIP